VERRRSGTYDARVLDIIENLHNFQAGMLNKMQETQNLMAQTQAVHANVLKTMADWQVGHEHEQREDHKQTETAITTLHDGLGEVKTVIREQGASMRTLAKVVAIVVPIAVAGIEFAQRIWPKVP
jgi:hemerythrin superfamily protein